MLQPQSPVFAPYLIRPTVFKVAHISLSSQLQWSIRRFSRFSGLIASSIQVCGVGHCRKVFIGESSSEIFKQGDTV